jgi:hypothetical protein
MPNTDKQEIIRPAIVALIEEAKATGTEISIDMVCDMQPPPNHLESTVLIHYLDNDSLAGRLQVTLLNTPKWPLFTPGYVVAILCAEEAVRLLDQPPTIPTMSNANLSNDVLSILDGMVVPIPNYTAYPQPVDPTVAQSYVEALWFLGREASERLAAIPEPSSKA